MHRGFHGLITREVHASETQNRPSRVLPPQFVDQGGHHERAQQAPQRVHGDGEGPQQSQHLLFHRYAIALHIGGVIEGLNELQSNSKSGQ